MRMNCGRSTSTRKMNMNATMIVSYIIIIRNNKVIFLEISGRT